MTNQTPVYQLVLDDLLQGLPGLTSAWGGFLAEAGAYCFEAQNHSSGVELHIKGTLYNGPSSVSWNIAINQQSSNSWNDEQEATEYGACGVAVLLILKFTDFTVVRRSRKGSGIDYWLAQRNSDKPFENAARLEVSGIFDGNENAVRTRVTGKLKQTSLSDGENLPVFVVVVEFGKPQSHLMEKQR